MFHLNTKLNVQPIRLGPADPYELSSDQREIRGWRTKRNKSGRNVSCPRTVFLSCDSAGKSIGCIKLTLTGGYHRRLPILARLSGSSTALDRFLSKNSSNR